LKTCPTFSGLDAPAAIAYSDESCPQNSEIRHWEPFAMYAIFVDGPHQYKVQEGDELDIDYRDVAAGDELKFDRVLAVSDGGDVKLGRPIVEGASVVAKVLGPVQGEKLVIQKLRRRKNFRKKTGHRSIYTRVEISRIGV
jgi:large subunit ribosomal protein L21